MIRYAKLTIKDKDPLHDGSSFNTRVAANCRVQERRDGYRYFVVGGLHGDVPNGNGDLFSWDGELFRQLNGRAIYASEEIEPHYPAPNFMYETWRGRGNYINHNSTPRNWSNQNRVGTIIDVYPNVPEKCIDFLLEVDESRAGWLVRAIDDGRITDTSMGTYVEFSTCECCGNIATSEDLWCSCLKERKGKDKCGNPNCLGGCKKYGMVVENNRDCTGLEDSWIISGHGADPKATHKYTVAMEGNEMAESLRRVSRASGAAAGGSASVAGDPDLREQIRLAKAARGDEIASQVSNDDETKQVLAQMASAIGVDQLRAMGLDPVALGVTSDEDENIKIAEEAEREAKQMELTQEQIKEAVMTLIAEGKVTLPSASMQSGTGGEGYMPNPNPESMVKPEQFGKPHSVAVPEIDKEIGQISSGSPTVPSASMQSGTGDEGYKPNTNPEAMVNPEQLGRDHSVTIPITTAQMLELMQGAAKMAISLVQGQEATIPSTSMESGGGDEKHTVKPDPLDMISGEKPGSPHSVTPIVDDRGDNATDAAMPTSATKAGEEGDQSYKVNTDPDRMVSPEQRGRDHSIKPAVEAKGKIPPQFEKNIKKKCECGKPGCKVCNPKKIKKSAYVSDADPANSAWLFLDEDNDVVMRLAARDAFPHDTADNIDWFSNTKYAEAVIKMSEKDGLVKTAAHINAQLGPTIPPGGQSSGLPPVMDDTGAPPAADGGPNANPNPDVSADIRGETKDSDGLSVEDTMVGVVAVMVNDGEATIDDVRSLFDGFKDPQSLEGFMGRVEQEMKDDKQSNEDTSDAMNGEPFDENSCEDMEKTAMLRTAAAGVEGDRQYYLKLYPPDFVNGLFLGSGKSAKAALETIEKLNNSNKALVEERSKMIQAKRVDVVVEEMVKKGMLRSAEDIIRDDAIAPDEAIRKAQMELEDRRASLMEMDEDSFNQFVEAVSKVKDRPNGATRTAGLRTAGTVRVPPVFKNSDVPGTQIDDMERTAGAEVSSIFSMPPDISETPTARQSERTNYRTAQKVDQQRKQIAPDDEDFMSSLSNSLTPEDLEDEGHEDGDLSFIDDINADTDNMLGDLEEGDIPGTHDMLADINEDVTEVCDDVEEGDLAGLFSTHTDEEEEE